MDFYEEMCLPRLNFRGWLKLVCYLVTFVLFLLSGTVALISLMFGGRLWMTAGSFTFCLICALGVWAFFRSGDNETIFRNGLDTK